MKISTLTSLVALFGVSLAVPTSKAPRTDGTRLFARELYCYDDYRCEKQDADDIANDLIYLGTRTCSAGNSWAELYSSGGCQVYARGDTTSYCQDVGYGVQNIADSCYAVGTTAGYNTAGGNGYFQIIVQTTPP